MTRIASAGVVVAGTGLLGLWLIVAGDAPDQSPVSTLVTAPPADRVHEGRGTTQSRERALFQEIVSARQAARMEAEARVRPQENGRVPSAPSVVVQKGDAKRDGFANARIAKMMVRIADAHGMTRREIEDIYRRGEIEGWPTIP